MHKEYKIDKKTESSSTSHFNLVSISMWTLVFGTLLRMSLCVYHDGSLEPLTLSKKGLG